MGLSKSVLTEELKKWVGDDSGSPIDSADLFSSSYTGYSKDIEGKLTKVPILTQVDSVAKTNLGLALTTPGDVNTLTQAISNYFSELWLSTLFDFSSATGNPLTGTLPLTSALINPISVATGVTYIKANLPTELEKNLEIDTDKEVSEKIPGYSALPLKEKSEALSEELGNIVANINEKVIEDKASRLADVLDSATTKLKIQGTATLGPSVTPYVDDLG